MAVKWVIDSLVSFFSWVINGFPAPDVPTWLTGLDTAISGVSTFIGSLQSWFPGTLAVAIITSWLLALSISIGIKVTRIVASFLTGGGGSAA